MAEITSTGRFATAQGSKYVQQLCKHFAHKVAVKYDAAGGWADLPPGRAEMRVQDDALEVLVRAENAQGLMLAKHIIDSHLVRFAFREKFEQMDWRDG